MRVALKWNFVKFRIFKVTRAQILDVMLGFFVLAKEIHALAHSRHTHTKYTKFPWWISLWFYSFCCARVCASLWMWACSCFTHINSAYESTHEKKIVERKSIHKNVSIWYDACKFASVPEYQVKSNFWKYSTASMISIGKSNQHHTTLQSAISRTSLSFRGSENAFEWHGHWICWWFGVHLCGFIWLVQTT